MITIKCDMPRTFKTNCNTKTKIDHGGIRNRYARFGLDVRRLIHYTTQQSAKWTLYVGVNILGPTLLRNQRASHNFNEVLCANSNFTEKFEQKVDGTVLGRPYSPILTYPVK